MNSDHKYFFKLILLIFMLKLGTIDKSERNCVFATNSDFLITISLEPNVADLRYFKLKFC